MDILIKNGRVIDPASATDDTLDILISGGRIADIGPRIADFQGPVIDASRLVVVPGLVDMHVHLREPGFADKETIAAGTRAAARGGFTSVACMPNTSPVNDGPRVMEAMLGEIRRSAVVNVFPVAAVSRGSRGEELTDMAALRAAGAVAFSDDGNPVANSRLMRRALESAGTLGVPVIDHCEDRSLTRDGVMHEGRVSAALGLKGLPAAAEDIVVARDLILGRDTGSPVHIAHLSTRGSAFILGVAKERGVRATAEVTPHHLVLTDESLEKLDTNFKMNPPLRSRADVEGLVEAVRSGVIDAIASDHAPQTEKDKSRDLAKAPFGVVGLETTVPLVLDRLVHKNVISLLRFAELMSANPARILGLDGKGRIAAGADADLTLLNVSRDLTVDKAAFLSKGRNTPFDGWKLKGQAVMTIVGGRVVFPFDWTPPSATGKPT